MALFIAYIVIQKLSPIGGLIVLLIFVLAFPWIIWRSLMFNMRITSFSNVRFGFDGKLGGSYYVYLLLPILGFFLTYSPIILTAVIFGGMHNEEPVFLIFLAMILTIALGIFVYALIQQKTTSYVINASKYGQAKFSTQLKVGGFVKIILKAFILSILLFIATFILLIVLGSAFGMLGALLQASNGSLDPEVITSSIDSELADTLIIIIPIFYIISIIASVAVFAYTFTRKRAYIFNNSKLDNKIALKSTLRARSLIYILITNFLLLIFTLGLATPWIKVRMARLILEHTEVDTSLGLDNYVTQQEKEQSSLGEQIGDAFDIDIGIGI